MCATVRVSVGVFVCFIARLHSVAMHTKMYISDFCLSVSLFGTYLHRAKTAKYVVRICSHSGSDIMLVSSYRIATGSLCDWVHVYALLLFICVRFICSFL